MSNRLIHLLLLATALYGSGAAIVMFSNGVSPRPLVAAATATAAPATIALAQTATLLPTVTVRPQPIVPTLATITIHSRGAHNPASDIEAPGAYSVSKTTARASRSPLAALPGGAFDMPYYSFGKSLRRVSKE